MGAYEFSGWGDIDRSADGGEPDGVSTSGTTAESRTQNAMAAEVLRAPDNERAFPQAGAGGSINERTASHEYGAS